MESFHRYDSARKILHITSNFQNNQLTKKWSFHQKRFIQYIWHLLKKSLMKNFIFCTLNTCWANLLLSHNGNSGKRSALIKFSNCFKLSISFWFTPKLKGRSNATCLCAKSCVQKNSWKIVSCTIKCLARFQSLQFY